ncbi:jg23365 [Pararge aegeria aegeria]|uniref:Jg23365 protein n=1 Tax=Pararge aegeria aegeria TaxID=348720 RepID=A0A8S4RJF8_9NEOP|nr:jg23365 [Pararge aegeria aegeria]
MTIVWMFLSKCPVVHRCGGGGKALGMQGGGAPAADADQAQFEADKRAVYKHPLFPLLALLLERCEQATAGAEAPAADAFGADLQAFVQHQRRDRRPFLVDDPEIDGLMIKSIQYICIINNPLPANSNHCPRITVLYLRPQSPAAPLGAAAFPPVYPAVTDLPFAPHRDPQNTEFGMVIQTPAMPETKIQIASCEFLGYEQDGDENPSGDLQCDAPLVVQGSTPIGQIGAGLLSTDSFTGTNSNSCSSVSGSPPPTGADEEGEEGGKRGVLPRHATQVMRAWLFQHLVHPYPTEEEKRSLAAQTRLTLLQVNNWFINARRRILQPMLDCQDKPAGGKKSKNGSSISKRYWTDALTNPQFTAGLLSSSEDEEQEGEHSADEHESQGEESSEHASYPPLQQPMH